jgi:D-alanyl-D-alanine dipeptidase
MRRIGALVAAAPKVGTHMSGSAIDISVLDRASGQEIDRGRPYLEMSELTPMTSPFVSPEAHANRQAITALMAQHGFVTYPWEFWHYNQGDAYDHYLNRTGQPARYGAVHVSLTDGSVEPIADPLTPLNTYEEIENELKQALARRGKG